MKGFRKSKTKISYRENLTKASDYPNRKLIGLCLHETPVVILTQEWLQLLFFAAVSHVYELIHHS